MMRCFIWNGNLDNGAYHEDASAVVFAESRERAVQLVSDGGDREYGYRWSPAMQRTDPSEVFEVGEIPERIVLLTDGCDC